ncbi:hypothetical protein PHMEG_00036256 [Phytophthora megakarya]|uniref:Uncharacterized protein n=1 Tax=Phytophthora megakarya TaxID=4795 RepID=A0A225UPS8_9STRA|nr:hypothetical protein PHMEG_00036256 [Phytophthora megakarya]
MIGGKAVNLSPIDADRAQMYINSRRGQLQPADGPAQIEKHYLSLVAVLSYSWFTADNWRFQSEMATQSFTSKND